MFAQRLFKLDGSSPQFPEQLGELLQYEEWAEHLQPLPEGELVELIDYLDSVSFISTPTEFCLSSLQILDGLDRMSSPFRDGLRVLRRVCSSRAILPTTYGMPGKFSLSAAVPVASGGFSDVYKESFGGADVCIKQLRRYAKDDPVKIQRVSSPHNLWPYHHTLTNFGGTLQRGCDVEVPQPPEYCTIQGYHPRTPTTRVRMDAWRAFEYIHSEKPCKLNQPCGSIPSRLQT